MRGSNERLMRELPDLRDKLDHAIQAGGATEQLIRARVTLLWPGRRRHRAAPPTEDGREHPVTIVEDPPSMQTRTDWFARELGSAWVEVEPGIYEHSASPPSVTAATLAGR